MKSNLERIADRELNRLKSRCLKELNETNVEAYADLIVKLHHRGINTNRHSYQLSKFYQELSLRERNNPRYEDFGASLELEGGK